MNLAFTLKFVMNCLNLTCHLKLSVSVYIPQYTLSNPGSIIPELQNRITHYDVANRVTNSEILYFLIFWVGYSMWKKLWYNSRVSSLRFWNKIKFEATNSKK